jgi:hypothetical protein
MAYPAAGFHRLFNQHTQRISYIMISSDDIIDSNSPVDNEFDYEPIDFRLPHEYRYEPSPTSLTIAEPSHPAQRYHIRQGYGSFPPHKLPGWRSGMYEPSMQQTIHPSPALSQMVEDVGVDVSSNYTMSSSHYHPGEIAQPPVTLSSAQPFFRGHHEAGTSQPHYSRMIWRSGLHSPCYVYEEDAGGAPIERCGTSALLPRSTQRLVPRISTSSSLAVNYKPLCPPSSSMTSTNYDRYDGLHQRPTEMQNVDCPTTPQRPQGPPPHVNALASTMLCDSYTEFDVLCGRGGATNSHPGNRKFRSIVARHRESYLAAKKKDKPSYAQYVVGLVRNQTPSAKCRFLKKDPNSDKWYDIGDEKAREKVAQALREGAAQLRRDQKRKRGERDDRSDSSSSCGSSGASSDSQADENKICKRAIVEIEVVKVVKNESDRFSSQMESVNPSIVAFEGRNDSPYPPPSDSEEESEQRSISLTPISIRPNHKLTLKKSCPFANVDDLSPSDRVLYLREFLPPHSQAQRGPRSGKQKIIRVQ